MNTYAIKCTYNIIFSPYTKALKLYMHITSALYRRPDVRRGLVHEQITPLHSAMNEFAHPFGVRYELQQTSMTGRVLVPPAIRYGQCAKPVERPR
jgi:hypothetical protein